MRDIMVKRPLTKQEIIDKHWLDYIDIVEHNRGYSRFKPLNEENFWRFYDFEYRQGFLAKSATEPGVEMTDG